MSVLIEGFSVVIRSETIEKKYPGGIKAFQHSCPDGTFCTDSYLISRIGFATLRNAENFASSLKSFGLSYVVDREFDEIAVLNQFDGLVIPCSWLEFGSIELFAGKLTLPVCQVKGCTLMSVACPISWYDRYIEGRRCISMDAGDVEKRLIFLSHENGFDYYLDILTNQECYFENTARKKSDA